MIDLSIVGAHVGREHSTGLQLGILLPGITKDKGYSLYADLIHSKDQFAPDIQAVPVELVEKDNSGGLWQFQGNMAALPPVGNLGKHGRHLYRYRLLQHDQVVVPAFSDPYAVL
ncbi:MAG: hypothetical protein D3910_28420, partial [Candidatus Electrothrix sp. ATG2]|nr:hypothetical protein [Candidatus Electrothrix sp. ATG2]